MSNWKRNRLRVLRAERRLTQWDVAQRLKISQASYSQIETGRREPDDRTRAQLARAFRVELTDLMPIEDARPA